MSKPIIAVDIDDVLSLSVKYILNFTGERWGQNLTHDDYNENLSIMWQVTPEEAEQRWLSYLAEEPMRHYEPIAEARATLLRLKQKYRLIAVTSRRAVLLPITKEWVEANYPGIMDEVLSSGIYGVGKKDAHAMTKAEVLQEISASYLIDDQVKHCVGAAGVGVKALLFGEYPWNSHQDIPTGVTRIKDWQAVLEYFAHEGV